MTPLAIMLLIQETLPPPPEPTSAPDINTAQVIGIVFLSLGLIVIAALALRPLVGRRRSDAVPEVEPAPTEMTLASTFEQGTHRPIIQFPTPVKAPELTNDWGESNPVIEERFGRVIGDSVGRHKLVDRRPARRAHDLAIAALHRLDTAPHPKIGARGAAVAERPIVPIDERRLGAVDRVPQRQILQWQGTIASDPKVATTTTANVDSETDNPERSAPALEESFAQGTVIDRVDSGEQARSSVQPADADYGLNIAGVDTQTVAEISQVLRDLIYCANTGELFHGFALYSDPYLLRFMNETGMTDDEFCDVYGSIGARPKAAWERLDRLSDVVRRSDGRIEATVSYVDVAGKPINGRERFRFAFDSERRVWMIDDIASPDELAE